MKKYVWLLIALFLCSSVEAATIISGRPCPGGAVAACSTPTTGSIMHEGFVGAGYELGAAWAETANGQTIDENASLPGTPPTGSCTEGLYIYSSETSSVYTTWDKGSAWSRGTTTNLVMEIYIDNDTTIDSTTTYFSFANVGGTAIANPVTSLRIYNVGGNYFVAARGATLSSYVAISKGAWHTITLSMNATADASTIDVDGTSQTFTRYDVWDARYLSVGIIEDQIGAGETVKFYLGRVYITQP